jgi:dienelactone hydrolase
MLRAAVRRHWRTAALVALSVVVVLAVGYVGYFATPLHGQEEGIAAVRADPDVVVAEAHGGYALRPAEGEATAGLVFYPGGRVAPDAYVATLAPLVERAGVAVVIPSMPLNLAVLDQDRASAVIEARPGIDRWYVGGHSLGGAMACRYAAGHERVAGLVLFASYCDVDLSGSGLAVLSVTGTADAVLNRDAARRNRGNLPDDARLVALEGVNHSQFGDYRGQPGGAPAGVTYPEAHARLAEAVVAWFEARAGGRE